MNCQIIKNKRCELKATTEYIKPDIIIGNESWLALEYTNSEIFPEGFNSIHLFTGYEDNKLAIVRIASK